MTTHPADLAISAYVCGSDGGAPAVIARYFDVNFDAPCVQSPRAIRFSLCSLSSPNQAVPVPTTQRVTLTGTNLTPTGSVALTYAFSTTQNCASPVTTVPALAVDASGTTLTATGLTAALATRYLCVKTRSANGYTYAGTTFTVIDMCVVGSASPTSTDLLLSPGTCSTIAQPQVVYPSAAAGGVLDSVQFGVFLDNTCQSQNTAVTVWGSGDTATIATTTLSFDASGQALDSARYYVCAKTLTDGNYAYIGTSVKFTSPCWLTSSITLNPGKCTTAGTTSLTISGVNLPAAATGMWQ